MQDTEMKYILSQRSSYLERSVMRSLLKHAVDPNLIAFATGLPANEDLPTPQLQACMNVVIERDGGAAFQYNPPYQPLKEQIADYVTARGIDASVGDIFITNGNQQALAILSQLFVDEGDSVVTEEIVYTGIQQGTRFTGATVHTVATDLESGVDVVELESIFQQHDVKFAVLIPDFHNPLGVAMSDAKRRKVAELAGQYRVPVMEDDAYSMLRFAGDMLPPVRSYDDSGYVFYCGSFSKMLAPALRLGFIIVPESLRTKITVIREASDLETSTFMQRMVAEFMQRGYLEPHIVNLRQSLKRRADALMTALDKYLGDVATWTVPEGGLFSWCVLPEQINTWEMFDDALKAGVVYLPGGAFSVKRQHTNTMRLNFSRVAPEKFDEGIKRLSSVIRDNL